MAEHFNFRAEIAYLGSGFFGFQKQPGRRTVESVLLDALRPLAPGLRGISVGGRTDRGVNATGQVISFWTRHPMALEEVAEALSAAAPGEVDLLDLRPVPRRFHARFCAEGRRYLYRLMDPELSVERLDAMLNALCEGRRCFSAFGRDTPAEKSTERRLWEAGARRVGDEILFHFCGDRFLRRQVRVMVGTAIREAQLGAGADALVRIADSKDRNLTAHPAAPEGLFLTKILYSAPERAR